MRLVFMRVALALLSQVFSRETKKKWNLICVWGLEFVGFREVLRSFERVYLRPLLPTVVCVLPANFIKGTLYPVQVSFGKFCGALKGFRPRGSVFWGPQGVNIVGGS